MGAKRTGAKRTRAKRMRAKRMRGGGGKWFNEVTPENKNDKLNTIISNAKGRDYIYNQLKSELNQMNEPDKTAFLNYLEKENIELYNFFTSNLSSEDYDKIYGTQPAPDPSKTSKKYNLYNGGGRRTRKNKKMHNRRNN